jgi:NO-binding membrane sensor protein with MHYT domain
VTTNHDVFAVPLAYVVCLAGSLTTLEYLYESSVRNKTRNRWMLVVCFVLGLTVFNFCTQLIGGCAIHLDASTVLCLDLGYIGWTLLLSFLISAGALCFTGLSNKLSHSRVVASSFILGIGQICASACFLSLYATPCHFMVYCTWVAACCLQLGY